MSFPIKKTVIFHSYVQLPEGKLEQNIAIKKLAITKCAYLVGAWVTVGHSCEATVFFFHMVELSRLGQIEIAGADG